MSIFSIVKDNADDRRGVMNWLPAVLFFFFYLFTIGGKSASEGRLMIWQLTLILLTASLFYHNRIWKLILAYGILNLLLIKGTIHSLPSLVTLWCIGLYASVIWHHNRFYAKHWFYTFFILWLISAYSIAAAHFDWPSLFQQIPGIRHLHYIKFAGAFTHTVHQGVYSAMLIPLAIVYLPYAIPFLIYTLVMAHCSAAIGALAVGLSVAACAMYKRVRWVIVPALLALSYGYTIFFDKVTNFSQVRFTYWSKLLDHVGFTWFGKGIGSFNNILGVSGVHDYEIGVFVNAHNFLIQWYYEMGVVGVLLILSYIAYMFKLLLRGRHPKADYATAAAVITGVLSCLWQPSMYKVEVGIPLLILCIVLERRLRNG